MKIFNKLKSAKDLLDLCQEKSLTLGAAESCTGGALSFRLASIPDASKVFVGSIVSYANSVKVEILEVPELIINTYGSVSEETTKAMLLGVFNKLNCDLGIAITGVAGPSGGTIEVPVGTVWVAIGRKPDNVNADFATQIFNPHLKGDRQTVIEQAVDFSIDALLSILKY